MSIADRTVQTTWEGALCPVPRLFAGARITVDAALA